MEDHEMQQLYKKGIQRLSTAPIFIDDSAALNIFELRAKCRRLVQKHKVGLVVIETSGQFVCLSPEQAQKLRPEMLEQPG